MIIFITIFEVLIFIFLSFLIGWKLAFNYGGEIKLNLKTFKGIYHINPDKWHYEKARWTDDIRHLFYQSSTIYKRIKLTFPAFIYFVFDKIRSNFKDQKEEENRHLILLLEDCQRDINRIKARAEKQIKKELENQKKILENWR